MTRSEIHRVGFASDAIDTWAAADSRRTNWPVVYVIDGPPSTGRGELPLTKVYVGESLNAKSRMHQHLDSGAKAGLQTVRVVVNDEFNKSVCLDLESFLIRLFAGDGAYTVLNVNGGITDADYYRREEYRASFAAVFDQLRQDGLFTRGIREIENSDLFKLSPFKALTQDQAIAIEDILEGLFADLETGATSTIVIQGSAGTGKTIVGIYLMKLLQDIGAATADDVLDSDWMFSEFYADGYRGLVADLRVGLVVPQQSLRESIRQVFRRTPRLSKAMVLSPFDVGKAARRVRNGMEEKPFDLLIVDEAHRLSQRANQPSAMQNTDFRLINERLFGEDHPRWTQLDWIKEQSTHQLFLVDAGQSVRPADLPRAVLDTLTATARQAQRHYVLTTQMRVQAGEDYVGYVKDALRPQAAGAAPRPRQFSEYELAFFDDLPTMRDRVLELDRTHKLARLVAGYAWPWVSRRNPSAFDIQLDGCALRWNSADKDWINSPGSVNEVGSIHTVQGYDLNYAGVIIGPELRYDPRSDRLFVDRASYHDAKGKENNPRLGKVYTDDELLEYVLNIYGVLLTRGMLGTFVYVCDPALRRYLRPFFEGRAGT